MLAAARHKGRRRLTPPGRTARPRRPPRGEPHLRQSGAMCGSCAAANEATGGRRLMCRQVASGSGASRRVQPCRWIGIDLLRMGSRFDGRRNELQAPTRDVGSCTRPITPRERCSSSRAACSRPAGRSWCGGPAGRSLCSATFFPTCVRRLEPQAQRVLTAPCSHARAQCRATDLRPRRPSSPPAIVAPRRASRRVDALWWSVTHRARCGECTVPAEDEMRSRRRRRTTRCTHVAMSCAR